MATASARLLQAVAHDVEALKGEYAENKRKVEAVAAWIKANWEPTFDDIKGITCIRIAEETAGGAGE